MEYMSDTVFYSGKKKRTVPSEKIYEKLKAGIKKKGQTKDWTCEFAPENECISIWFGDGESETFTLEFDEKGAFSGCCKLFLPLDETTNEEDRTLMMTLLDLLYKAKSNFNTIQITDDYGLAQSYWESKKFKFEYRELSESEYNRVERLFRQGYTTHEELLRAIMAEDMEMSYEEFRTYEHPDIAIDLYKGMIENSLATYLYETSRFKNEKRVSDSLANYVSDPNKYMFALWGFEYGVGWIFRDGTTHSYYEGQRKQEELTSEKHRCVTPIDAQIDLVYREKFLPLFSVEKDALMQCVLAYRYFLSVYEFTGFRYDGHKHIGLILNTILEEYGRETGELFLTFYVTTKWYIDFKRDKKERKEKFVQNITKRYGKELLERYLQEFQPKYGEDCRLKSEVENCRLLSEDEADRICSYTDETLVQ